MQISTTLDQFNLYNLHNDTPCPKYMYWPDALLYTMMLGIQDRIYNNMAKPLCPTKQTSD